MFDYYDISIIPMILSSFNVQNVIMCGLSDKDVTDYVLSYCLENNHNFIAIDPNCEFEHEIIRVYGLNLLSNLSNLWSNFLKWWYGYTVFNELNIIKENNVDFPWVFVCNNVFPHKRRDTYINPSIIPNKFKHKYSSKISYNGCLLMMDITMLLKKTLQRMVF